jgi:Ankyrin repeats (3 copies)
MKNSDITDPIFLEAVEAIDAGNISLLEQLLNKHPRLVSDRLDISTEGYFNHPYLLWFIADNPIRHGKLPANIAEITRLIIQFVRKEAAESFGQQIDYTLGLVATGRIPRECGVQIELMDLLIDAGAKPGSGHGALAHGNIEAARRLIERGGTLTLTTAICLDRTDDFMRLAKKASHAERQTALVAAAFYGKADMLVFLIEPGVDLNAYPDVSSGFHSHATALHQAVYSGSLEAVKVLVKAGAKLNITDRIYHGTPLGWAKHIQTEEKNENARKKYAAIESFLISQQK